MQLLLYCQGEHRPQVNLETENVLLGIDALMMLTFVSQLCSAPLTPHNVASSGQCNAQSTDSKALMQ